jgi:hypothetical protein
MIVPTFKVIRGFAAATTSTVFLLLLSLLLLSSQQQSNCRCTTSVVNAFSSTALWTRQIATTKSTSTISHKHVFGVSGGGCDRTCSRSCRSTRSQGQAWPDRTPALSSSSSTQLSMIGDLLNGILGKGSQGSGGDGSTVVLDIPSKAVKIGPIKFYLQIYLVGEQNKPTKGAWFLKQNDNTQTLDMYYGDGTAMLSIDVKEYLIQIRRYGQRPSLQYMLQESVLLHGVLDELETLAFGINEEDIAPENRLLQFADDQMDVLSTARETLPARREGGSD